MKNEWKRLTQSVFEKMNMYVTLKQPFKNYEVEYLILPDGEWKKETKFDGRMINNIERIEPKIVYRYREIDKAEKAYNQFLIEYGNIPMSIREIFKAGFEAGKESK